MTPRLGTILLLMILTSPVPAQPGKHHPAKCHGNLYQQSPAIQKKMTRFLTTLQERVASSQKSQVAAMMAYPLNAWIKGKNREIHSRSEFVQLYNQVLPRSFQRLLLNQRPSCISRVGVQGLSFAHGQLWFDIYPDGQVRAFTITPIVYPRASHQRRESRLIHRP